MTIWQDGSETHRNSKPPNFGLQVMKQIKLICFVDACIQMKQADTILHASFLLSHQPLEKSLSSTHQKIFFLDMLFFSSFILNLDGYFERRKEYDEKGRASWNHKKFPGNRCPQFI